MQAFGSIVSITIHSAYRSEMEEKTAYEICRTSGTEIPSTSDAITLHVPLMDSTRHMIGEKEIEKMKNGAILINVARGGLMDDEAVVKAVNSGKLSGAGIDCVEEEPAKPGNPFSKIRTSTPHQGGGSADISDVMFPMITGNIGCWQLEKELKYVVNKQYLEGNNKEL